MTFKAAKIQLQQLTEGRDAYIEKIRRLRAEMIKYCPVQVGDRVTANSEPEKGRLIEIIQIGYIGPDNRGRAAGKADFYCRGRVIKADGKPSKFKYANYFCNANE